jgi:hypothetical protein
VKQEKHIRTCEDWYPTVNGEVRVFIAQLTTGQWRVAAWGGDDFGLELDTDSEKVAGALYESLKDYTTQSEMRILGMGPA